jgi:hypothetical protein
MIAPTTLALALAAPGAPGPLAGRRRRALLLGALALMAAGVALSLSRAGLLALAGAGLGSFLAIFPRYQEGWAYGLVVDQAHSDLLELLLEAGLPATLALLACVALGAGRALAAARDAAPEARALAQGLLGALAAAAVRALADFDLALPGNAVVLAVLAGVLAGTAARAAEGRPRGALAVLGLVVLGLALAPRDSVLRVSDRAWARFEAGDRSPGTLEELRRAVRLAPAWAETNARLARALAESGDPALEGEARRHARAATVRQALAAALLRAGEAGEALAALDRVALLERLPPPERGGGPAVVSFEAALAAPGPESAACVLVGGRHLAHVAVGARLERRAIEADVPPGAAVEVLPCAELHRLPGLAPAALVVRGAAVVRRAP